MGERFIVDIESGKKSHLDGVLSGLNGAVNKVAENISPPDTSVAEQLAILNQTISAGFAAVVAEIAKLQPPEPPPAPTAVEVKFMFVVKDDNPDVNFSLVLGDVTDAEGNAIPDAQVDLKVASTDDAVVAVTFDPATKSGSVHFGNPGTATITATVSSGENLLGSGAADFTVTTGDPAAISGVDLTFEGLTEQ